MTLSVLPGNEADLAAAPRDRDSLAPRSAVPAGDGLAGLGGLTLAFLLVLAVKPDPLAATWLVLLATAVPMLVRELVRAPAIAAGKRQAGHPVLWLVGFIVATAPFLVVHGQHTGLMLWGAAWVVIAPAFALRLVIEAIRRGGPPAGGFPLRLGSFLRRPSRDGLRGSRRRARLWSLKAFFIPLYALSLNGLISLALTNPLDGPLAWLGLAVTFAYTIDLGFGLGGYVFASNDLVPTIRSTQTRWLGWLVCLCCYGPAFGHWPAFESVVSHEIGWPELLTLDPLVIGGGVAMLVLLAIYVSATIRFGLRFCNLANRGVIAGGPYRLMKHPAYFAHVGNAWIITCIFPPAAGVTLGPSQLLVPLAFTVLYRLRAVTEEQHMGEDEEYRAYADWISRHGLLARLRRLLPGASRLNAG